VIDQQRSLRDRIAAELRAIVPGDRHVLTEPEDLISYGYDGTWYEQRPLVVVSPETTEQVSRIHRLASAERIPLTPRGMGSGLSGGSVPAGTAIVISLMRMNRILEIDEINGVAVVQPGVITADLQSEVEKRGLFYPPDPSSLRQSAIGGNIAENSGGSRCLKYGVTTDYVQALEIVLPDGAVIRTGGKMVKNVTGYNLRALFTGAEGTLGTVTEITLRLIPKPKHARTALVSFSRLEDAARAVPAIMSAGMTPTSIELLDKLTMECVEEYANVGLPLEADAILLIGVDGNYEEVLDAELRAIETVVRAHGASDIRIATSDVESEKLWAARRAISPALARKRPNKLGEDISIPRSAIPDMAARVREIASRYRLLIPLFGHAGDGNLHPNILCDRSDADEMQRVTAAAREIFEAAVELEGTLSGEHGIGLLKKQFMEFDLGKEQVELMRRIKAAVDPDGIMNPGKIFPDPGGVDAFRLPSNPATDA
jgi:glycolate oxidase